MPPLHNIFASVRSMPFLSFIEPIFVWNNPLVSLIFLKRSLLLLPLPSLEEISGLSHSIVFLYFFALIAEVGVLISPYYSLELCIQMGISFFSPLLSTSLLFIAICKASSDSNFGYTPIQNKKLGNKQTKKQLTSNPLHEGFFLWSFHFINNLRGIRFWTWASVSAYLCSSISWLFLGNSKYCRNSF